MLRIEIIIQQQGVGAIIASTSSGSPTDVEGMLGLVVMQCLKQVEDGLRKSGDFKVTNILEGQQSKPHDN